MIRFRAALPVFAISAGACHRTPLRSITPAVNASARLFVPLLGGDFAFEQVIADVRVPVGYRLSSSADGSEGHADFGRLQGDPWISLVSAFATENGKRKPPDFIEGDCSRAGYHDDNETRVRFEKRPTGTLVICQRHERQPDVGVLDTVVARDFRWRGDRFQCQVSFGELGDLGAPYDHGNPSPARIADAIALCDTMTLRPAPAQGSNASGLSGSEDPP